MVSTARKPLKGQCSLFPHGSCYAFCVTYRRSHVLCYTGPNCQGWALFFATTSFPLRLGLWRCRWKQWPFPVLQRKPRFVSSSFPVSLPFVSRFPPIGSNLPNEAISPAHIAGRFSYTSPRSWRVSPTLTRFLYSRPSCARCPRRLSGRPRGTDGRLRSLMLRVWLASGLVRLPLTVRLPLEPLLLANEVEPSVVPHRSSAGGGGFYSWACFSLTPSPP